MIKQVCHVLSASPSVLDAHRFATQALALSQISNPFVEGDNTYIAEATRGVLFLATPHFGSQYAFGGVWWARLFGIFGGTYSGLLQSLQLLSPQLQHLNQDFLTIPVIRNLPQRSLVCFYETKGLLFGVSIPVAIALEISSDRMSARGRRTIRLPLDRHARESECES